MDKKDIYELARRLHMHDDEWLNFAKTYIGAIPQVARGDLNDPRFLAGFVAATQFNYMLREPMSYLSGEELATVVNILRHTVEALRYYPYIGSVREMN